MKNSSSSSNYQVSVPHTVFIVGPTASGKSQLGMQIAQTFRGEIICADSQTIRRGMDIGTAKPDAEDQKKIKHHMLDIVDPYDRFTAADFSRRAEAILADCLKRGVMPIVVGGTGLYCNALLYGYSFKGVVDPMLRAELESKSVSELQQIIIRSGYTMPNNPMNPRHLIRAIESKGEQPKSSELRSNTTLIGLMPEKEMLQERISNRIDAMLAAGFVDEVATLIKEYGPPPKNWDAIGYSQVATMLINENINLSDLKQKLFIAHRQYAKRQRDWFKRDKNIQWYASVELAAEALDIAVAKRVHTN